VKRSPDDATDWTFGGSWPYPPRWLELDGASIHYVDEGDRAGQPVIMVHQSPAWSYIYRDFIGPLASRGYRAIAYDQMGFGRSSKPEDTREYSLARHTKQLGLLVDALGLDRVTLVVHDWGGPTSLGWALRNPQRLARLVLFNTYTGSLPPDLAAARVHDFGQLFALHFLRTPLIGELFTKGAHLFVRLALLNAGVVHRERLGPAQRAAYLSPHRTWGSRTPILAHLRLIAFDKDCEAAQLGRFVEQNLGAIADKPVLICWAMRDQGFGPRTLASWRSFFPRAEVHQFEDAGFCIQEDAHERVVPILLDFLGRPDSRVQAR
jgi:haloalkane dehalogenase